MTPNEITIAMARLDGYTRLWGAAYGQREGEHYRELLPNYLEDHNAVQRVIDKLTIDQGCNYALHLGMGSTGLSPEELFAFIGPEELFSISLATPAQKCDFILMATGLWKEGE